MHLSAGFPSLVLQSKLTELDDISEIISKRFMELNSNIDKIGKMLAILHLSSGIHNFMIKLKFTGLDQIIKVNISKRFMQSSNIDKCLLFLC